MVFSSITFLFYFLPLVVMSYWLSPVPLRNFVLLLASLFFYAWGEGVYVMLMIVSICVNYTCGRLIESNRAKKRDAIYLVIGVGINLLFLCYFKYANFLSENVDILLRMFSVPTIDLAPIRLPIGISFFTFQALSYLIDVYREEVDAQKNFFHLSLYIALFPQLIAGPIVRYQTIRNELCNRHILLGDMAGGVERFLFGLSKKVLLANPIGLVADQIFSLPQTDVTPVVAWLGAVCYTFQIYYDFSGYSDMAIGLGRMFGFHFLENFNYPYISRSIKEFWRRWHISLSTWFRDYVYFPMGGNRKGGCRTSINLVTIFLLCGLWHGASWTFVLWGGYHGFFLALERTAFGRLQTRLWAPVQCVVTLLIVIVGWVIFRSETVFSALFYIENMSRIVTDWVSLQSVAPYWTDKLQVELLVAVFLATPVYSSLKGFSQKIDTVLSLAPVKSLLHTGRYFLRFTIIMTLVYFSTISLAAGVYNPFIYFRF